MKKIIALVLACVLFLFGCMPQTESNSNSSSSVPEINDGIVQSIPNTIEPSESSSILPVDIEQDDTPRFNNLNDTKLLQYVEDTIYAGLADEFSSEDYIIENVSTIYYSKEYLEEVAYNSKANIFYGYTLAELDEQFQGEQYVFTLSDDGETTVQLFEDYDDTYDKVIKNVAIGTGVILVCVTVSVVSGGVGAPTVSMIFAASAKTGTMFALSSAAFSGVFAGAVTGIQTNDFEQAISAAALAGSEEFKWGAISGVLIGGLSEVHALGNAANAIDDVPSWRQSELDVLDQYGGKKQVAYWEGQEVPFSTPGSTRPDVVRTVDNHLEAIEVKNYNLKSPSSLNTLYSELQREIRARIANCPPGTTQRVVLDVRGRNFTQELISSVTETIETKLINIYPNIPIDILGV